MKMQLCMIQEEAASNVIHDVHCVEWPFGDGMDIEWNGH
jgi:hypothetical protein